MNEIVKRKEDSLAVIVDHRELAMRPSFGGLTLAENAEKVQTALDNFYPLLHTWNRTKSEWIFKHGNCKYMDPLGNLKQVTAELGSKQAALRETKWRYLKNEAKLARKRERLDSEELTPAQRQLIEIQIAELEEGMVVGMRHIEGCFKDVLVLEDLRKQLMDQIGEFSEEDYEAQEAEHHICLSLNQSLRDVRETGKVFKGNAEYLEWIGLNVMAVQKALLEAVELEKQMAEEDNFDGTYIIDFLRTMAKKLCHISNERARKLGFTTDEFFNRENVNRQKVQPDGPEPDIVEVA